MGPAKEEHIMGNHKSAMLANKTDSERIILGTDRCIYPVIDGHFLWQRHSEEPNWTCNQFQSLAIHAEQRTKD
jgi:hypothetical protein